jgi:diazepam-binding inhibitor (GABA receptor modulating acyl-CoA-binding protein)
MKEERIKRIFDESCEKVKQYTVSQENQLKLYGLYKQALFGDNTTQQPGMFDLRGRAKYNAWSELKGKSKYLAMKEYILLVRSLKET